MICDTWTLNWLAGLLEGEGFFGTIKNYVGGKCYRYPRLGVSMTDLDVIERVGKLWNIKPSVLPGSESPPRKTQYRVILCGKKAVEYMECLYPLLGIRRQGQIQKTLDEWYSRENSSESRIKLCKEFSKTRTRNSKGEFVRN